MDDPDCLEIWNLVFMQFNREVDGSLSELPAKSVDTGMGLERVTSVLCDVRSNYDTDLFSHIFDAIQEKCKCKPYAGRVGDDDTDGVDMAYRVIADHIRTLTIALTDGAVPSNDGRGYVLRRILRRAVRYGHEKLSAPPGFFHQLVDSAVDTLGDAFPTLKQNPKDVIAIIKEEEEQFGRTLEKGIAQFKRMSTKGSISGEDACMLFTSFGFPIDLTERMAEEQKIEVDIPGFEAKMNELREKSKKAKTNLGEKDMTLYAAQTDMLINKMKLATTDESSKYDWDTKGDGKEFKATVKAIYLGKNPTGDEFVDKVNSSNGVVGLILDTTPLYAEQGGQTFDIADIVTDSGTEFSCHNCQKYAGYVLHTGTIGSKGDIKVGEKVKVKVDYTRRSLIAKNHTATHILNFALRQVLGEKVDQKGSLVDEDKLRFDFAHNKPIETEELREIEKICNEQIAKAHQIFYKEVELDRAMKIGGLRAVFGEKYPDPVRVVSVGPEVDKMLANQSTPWGKDHSIEFCGGTHVFNSQEIYKFVLLTEEGVAKGVRRLVAVTGPQAAVQAVLKSKALVVEVDEAKTLSGALLDTKIADLRQKVGVDKEVSMVMKRDMLTDLDNLKVNQVKAGKASAKEFEKKAKEVGEKLAAEASKASGDTFVAVVDAGEGDDGKACGGAMEVILKKNPSKAVCLLSNAGGKLAVLVMVPKDLVGKLSAKKWLDKVMAACDGKGGGKDDTARGQAADPKKLDAALAAAKSYP
eukprot:gnl/TRDRNA2_/TRDRNA2_81087_c0_seq1.p1 gnl/TRDRNA2_/TRDRNA2_81087_c0~~gnl/TRDRNA2_/TRDRNA2_81087_c0_seq1.p1  ORF type:complete len:774 (-),score=248.53 gnl/TRDRNA2_/TRDRNA2_81087_c0_seq1:125-2374(-)